MKRKIIFQLIAIVIISLVLYSCLQLEPNKPNMYLSFMAGGVLMAVYTSLTTNK